MSTEADGPCGSALSEGLGVAGTDAGAPMQEHELQQLLELATGQGRWAWTGPYMHTYPGGKNNAIHEGCVELERRGLLVRKMNEPSHVCWIATPNKAIIALR